MGFGPSAHHKIFKELSYLGGKLKTPRKWLKWVVVDWSKNGGQEIK